jgi:hypothetical protein
VLNLKLRKNHRGGKTTLLSLFVRLLHRVRQFTRPRQQRKTIQTKDPKQSKLTFLFSPSFPVHTVVFSIHKNNGFFSGMEQTTVVRPKKNEQGWLNRHWHSLFPGLGSSSLLQRQISWCDQLFHVFWPTHHNRIGLSQQGPEGQHSFIG